MEILQEIIMLYYEINNIYLELYNLELNGEKNSLSFLQLINLLKEKLLKEDKLYSLFTDKEKGTLLEMIEDSEDAFSKRIRDYIKYYNVVDISLSEDNDKEITEEIDEELNEEELLVLEHELIKIARLYDVCAKNIMEVYLSFLQEYIGLSSFSDVSNKLLEYKYHNSFINHDIEKKLIDFNFDVPRVNFNTINLFTSMIGLRNEFCNMTIRDCYIDTINLVVSQLLLISDDDYNDVDKRTISINNQCMLRACMCLLRNGDYDSIKEQLVEFINRLSNEKDRVSVMIINSIIEDRKKDKVRVRNISFKPMSD